MIVEKIQEQMAKIIKYIKPTEYGSATGLTAETYQQMQTDFMHGPVLTLHSPAPEVLAAVWTILRETLLAGQVDRTLKEIVAVTVSKLNECPFCVDAHTLMLHATSEHEVANVILRGDHDSIHDPRHHSLVQWVLANRTPNADDLYPLPFSRDEAPEMIGTAVTFHYINRMVNVFLEGGLLPLAPAFKRLTGHLFGVTAGKRFVRQLQRGSSLKLVPQAKLPDDLSWAAADPVVASAFAGFARVIEEAGRVVLPEPVRFLVNERIRAWNGEAMSLSRRWVEDTVVEIAPAHQAAARLALLTALASYQVDSHIIKDFRSQYPDEAQLIAVTAWASFAAARWIGVWFAQPFVMMGRG